MYPQIWMWTGSRCQTHLSSCIARGNSSTGPKSATRCWSNTSSHWQPSSGSHVDLDDGLPILRQRFGLSHQKRIRKTYKKESQHIPHKMQPKVAWTFPVIDSHHQDPAWILRHRLCLSHQKRLRIISKRDLTYPAYNAARCCLNIPSHWRPSSGSHVDSDDGLPILRQILYLSYLEGNKMMKLKQKE